MELQGIPGMTDATRSFIQMVRAFMRDYPELNRLVRGVESSDRMIAWAIKDALSGFNGTPPNLGRFTVDDLLARDQSYLLLRMTVCALIESVGLLQTRNHLNYSTGGTSVGVNDKTPLLMNWLQYFRASVDQAKLRIKTAWNIESILGEDNAGVFSEYWVVHGTYLRY